MSFIKEAFNKTVKAFEKISDDHVDAFSAKAAFFIIVSFFPFVMFVLNILNYFPLYDNAAAYLMMEIVPNPISDMLLTFINELSAKASGTILSASAIVMLWSASVGMLAISRGLNVIYKKHETRNYYVLRAISMIYTTLLVILLFVTLAIIVFGKTLSELLIRSFPALSGVTAVVLSLRSVVALVVLTILFLFVYTILPNGRNKIRNQLPGALFSSVGWIVYSVLFSFYIDNFADYSYIYGSITAVLILMLWLYFCMYILFIGAELNMYFMNRKKC